MLYVWLDENGNVCATYSLEFVPSGVEVVVFEDLTISDLDKVKVENGRIVRKTDEDFLSEVKEEKLKKLKEIIATLLEPTDYILFKFQEALLLGEDTSLFLQKYKKQLEWRNNVRQWGEEKKRLIRNAQTKEELDTISFDDYPKLEE